VPVLELGGRSPRPSGTACTARSARRARRCAPRGAASAPARKAGRAGRSSARSAWRRSRSSRPRGRARWPRAGSTRLATARLTIHTSRSVRLSGITSRGLPPPPRRRSTSRRARGISMRSATSVSSGLTSRMASSESWSVSAIAVPYGSCSLPATASSKLVRQLGGEAARGRAASNDSWRARGLLTRSRGNFVACGSRFPARELGGARSRASNQTVRRRLGPAPSRGLLCTSTCRGDRQARTVLQ